MWLLSVYGSNDGVLEQGAYQKARSLWPARTREVVIEGGNHAGFAYYGSQAGDGVATIDPRRQQDQVTQAIIKAMQELQV